MLRYLDIFTFSRGGFLLKLFSFGLHTQSQCAQFSDISVLEVCGLSRQFISKVCVSHWLECWSEDRKGRREKGWVLHCTVRPTRHVTLFFPVALFMSFWVSYWALETWNISSELKIDARVTSSSISSLALQGHYGRCCSERVPRSSLMLSPHTAVNLFLIVSISSWPSGRANIRRHYIALFLTQQIKTGTEKREKRPTPKQ